MTNKRKMQRARRIYGNLKVKKRRKERLKELARKYTNAIKICNTPFVLFYDSFTCRYFRCRQEAITAAYNTIKKNLEEYRSRVAEEFGEAT